MNSYLLYRNKNFNWEKPLSSSINTIFTDLEMETIFQIMAQNNSQIYNCVKQVFAQYLTDLDEIKYRQEILKDCIRNPWIFNQIQKILNRVEEQQERLNRRYGLLKDYPTSLMSISLSMIEIFLDELRQLKNSINEQDKNFSSEGFRRLFNQINTELNDQFFIEVENHLNKLKFPNGMIVSTNLSEGLKAGDYIICDSQKEDQTWLRKFFDKKPENYQIKIREKNDNSARALSDLKERILNTTANILMQSVENLSNFFKMFQKELLFYQGCLNLKDFLEKSRFPICFPVLTTKKVMDVNDLYDTSLAIIKGFSIGNDFKIQKEYITFITGANQGGKTTFLRSLGQAILMGQSGLFVGAQNFQSFIFKSLFTYFRKEEDDQEESGKLDEELKRMNEIVNFLKPDSCILMNEPFASTNEREGAEIGFQIIKALSENKIFVFCVTHLFSLTSYFLDDENVLFLRAERKEDGQRTFKLSLKKPLQTGFGIDLYNSIFN